MKCILLAHYQVMKTSEVTFKEKNKTDPMSHKCTKLQNSHFTGMSNHHQTHQNRLNLMSVCV